MKLNTNSNVIEKVKARKDTGVHLYDTTMSSTALFRRRVARCRRHIVSHSADVAMGTSGAEICA